MGVGRLLPAGRPTARCSARAPSAGASSRVHPGRRVLGTAEAGRSRRLSATMSIATSPRCSGVSTATPAHGRRTCATVATSAAMGRTFRRIVSRFWKCYVGRRGYREGPWGFLIALCAALYPILSYLKARLETSPEAAPHPALSPLARERRSKPPACSLRERCESDGKRGDGR